MGFSVGVWFYKPLAEDTQSEFKSVAIESIYFAGTSQQADSSIVSQEIGSSQIAIANARLKIVLDPQFNFLLSQAFTLEHILEVLKLIARKDNTSH